MHNGLTSFEANVLDVHGAAGAEWLRRIPEIVDRCARTWSLTIGKKLASSYSCIIDVTMHDDTPAVLKLSFPDPNDREADALRAFDGRGAVALLADDRTAGAMLLERAVPGTPLVDDGDASLPERILLHGDLHRGNILASQRGWLAIDPKGIVGERACEIAPLVFEETEGMMARLDRLCAGAGIDRERAVAWAFVRVVLGIVWAIEDHGTAPQKWIESAQALRRQQ